MNNPQNLPWYDAITLVERIDSLPNLYEMQKGKGKVQAIGQRRLEKWRAQRPFASNTFFSQRLAHDGVDEMIFSILLGESTKTISNRFGTQPSWLTKLQKAFTTDVQTRLSFSNPATGQETIGFLQLVAPLISQGLQKLRGGVWLLTRAYKNPPFIQNQIEQILLTCLAEQLITILNRTLILELNVARIQGKLQGQTSQARFHHFLQSLTDNEVALSLLQEYPVLARQITICIEQWTNSSLEFLKRLCTDWSTICTHFNLDDTVGTLKQINIKGDPHRSGRTVFLLKFTNGFQLVYKPKPLSVDVHFQSLLTWFNEKASSKLPNLRTIQIIARQNYGWVEFVPYKSCSSIKAIQRFYLRQGAFLALFYILEATDFHYENLIAYGEHPIPIDLETLFHPHLHAIDPQQPDSFAQLALVQSVLRIGLLPERVWGNNEAAGVDISGFGALKGQFIPKAMPYFASEATDEMHLEHKPAPLPAGQNLPMLNGLPINPYDYLDFIIEGFSQAYTLLCQQREALLAPDGPLAQFAEDEVRVIIRPTKVYDLLLNESYHPNVLRNALDREQLFDRLWAEVEYHPSLMKVINQERADLWCNDIPIFTTRPNSHHLWSSDGTCIPDFLTETGVTLVKNRVNSLSKTDLTRQLWLIRASLMTTLAIDSIHMRWPHYTMVEPIQQIDKQRILAHARKVGDQLIKIALKNDEGQEVTWVGLTFLNEHQWSFAPSGPDLYSGLAGIILFLAQLSHTTHDTTYEAVAHMAFNHWQKQIKAMQVQRAQLGAFNGWGSIIYVLTHLSVLWQKPALLKQAEALAKETRTQIAEDKGLDIIAGTAGYLGSLLTLYGQTHKPEILDIAIQCGHKLVATAQKMPVGLGWQAPTDPTTPPLTGYSHGTSGIAAMLFKLWGVTQQQSFYDTAVAAFAYEESLFSVEMQNWPDLQKLGDNDISYQLAWCHGAPGIGLARLQSLPYIDTPQIRGDIEVALKTTLDQGFGYNHSLCHGELGNIELFLAANQQLGEPTWQQPTQRLTAIIIESIEQHGWFCGMPQGTETPGLMTGLAGIGYGLLRLAAPDKVPSVLTLQSPKHL